MKPKKRKKREAPVEATEPAVLTSEQHTAAQQVPGVGWGDDAADDPPAAMGGPGKGLCSCA